MYVLFEWKQFKLNFELSIKLLLGFHEYDQLLSLVSLINEKKLFYSHLTKSTQWEHPNSGKRYKVCGGKINSIRIIVFKIVLLDDFQSQHPNQGFY